MRRVGRVPDDPLHPYFYHVYASTLPPEAAYRVVPKKKGIVSSTLEISKSKAFQSKRRYVFQGWGNYTVLEIEWLAKVKA